MMDAILIYLLSWLTCIMGAAVEFNLALFHIFSGPLFANLEGYVYLDLLIWGFSPILFQLMRAPLTQILQMKANYQSISEARSFIRKTRMIALSILSGVVFLSFLFMNYSESFNWNYFSRIINLDFGYLMFDLSCRSIQLIVEIEQQQHQSSGKLNNIQAEEKKSHFQGYCKLKNLSMLASYLLIFYLSSQYDVNLHNSGKQIFKIISTASCVVTISVPILYIFAYSQSSTQASYRELRAEEDYHQNQIITFRGDDHYHQVMLDEGNPANQYYYYGLINFSLMVNVSYFSLWILEGIKSEKMESSFQQFNKAVFMSATFFLISSFILFMSTHTLTYLINRAQKHWITPFLSQTCNSLIKLFLIIYGGSFLYVFIANKRLAWHSIALLIIPFSLHYVLAERSIQHLEHVQDQQRHSQNKRIPQRRLYFILEILTYFVIPLFLTLCGLSDYTLQIYGYLSAACLVLAGVIR